MPPSRSPAARATYQKLLCPSENPRVQRHPKTQLQPGQQVTSVHVPVKTQQSEGTTGHVLQSRPLAYQVTWSRLGTKEAFYIQTEATRPANTRNNHMSRANCEIIWNRIQSTLASSERTQFSHKSRPWICQHIWKSGLCPKILSHEDNRFHWGGYKLLTERNTGKHR